MNEKPRDGGSFLNYGSVQVFTTATKIINQTGTTGVLSRGRGYITLLNTDSVAIVFIGDSNVTSGNGFKLLPGASITLHSRAEIWGLQTGSDTVDVRFIADEA